MRLNTMDEIQNWISETPLMSIYDEMNDLDKYNYKNSEINYKSFVAIVTKALREKVINEITLSNFEFSNFISVENLKIIIDDKKIDDKFIGKDDQYLKKMVNINSRKQLAEMQYKTKIKEINDFKSFNERAWTKYLLWEARLILKLQKKYISKSYKVAIKKFNEANMLIANDENVFYKKTTLYTNTFLKEKKVELKKELKNVSRKDFQQRSQILSEYIDYDYDNQYNFHLLQFKDEYRIQKQAIQEKYKAEHKLLEDDLKKYSESKTQFKSEVAKNLKNLRKNYKEKTSHTSNSEILEELKIEFFDECNSIKQQNKYLITKEKIRFTKNLEKIECKKNKAVFETNVSNTRNSIPFEKHKLISILCIIFGVIPGFTQFTNKQWVKGCLLFFVGLPITSILLLYSFGIGNVGGNGIFGLIDFGKASMETGDIFDVDGRFYFVESILGIMLLLIAISYFTICYYSSLITNKQTKMGGRPTIWMNTKKYLQNQGLPYVLTLPSLIGILLIVVFPVVSTFVIAFTDYGKGSDPANPGQVISWVGFDNFVKIFGGEYGSSFMFVFKWTIIWVIFAGFGGIVVGTIFCLLINNDRLKGKKIFRVIMILPGAVPGFVMVLMFSILFASSTFNNFTLSWFGISGWTTKLGLARIALIFVNAWLSQTYIFLLFTGVSQGISKDLYDSAKIDGANPTRQTFKITLPILFSQTGPLLIGQFTGAFSNFGIIALFNANSTVLGANGQLMAGNPGMTDILISFVYKITNDQSNYSYGLGAAFIIIFSFFTVTMAFLGMRNMKAFKKGVV